MKRTIAMLLACLLVVPFAVAEHEQPDPTGIYSQSGELLFSIGDSREKIEEVLGEPVNYIAPTTCFDPEAYIPEELKPLEDPDVFSAQQSKKRDIIRILRDEEPASMEDALLALADIVDEDELQEISRYRISKHVFDDGNLTEKLDDWEDLIATEDELYKLQQKNNEYTSKFNADAPDIIRSELTMGSHVIRATVRWGSIHAVAEYLGISICYTQPECFPPSYTIVTATELNQITSEFYDKYDGIMFASIAERNLAISAYVQQVETYCMTKQVALYAKMTGPQYATSFGEYAAMPCTINNEGRMFRGYDRFFINTDGVFTELSPDYLSGKTLGMPLYYISVMLDQKKDFIDHVQVGVS